MEPLGPEELERRRPPKRRGRYDTSAVDRLLDDVTASYARLWDERERLRVRAEAAQVELDRLHGLERGVSDALVVAHAVAAERRAQIEREAEEIVRRAEADAARVTRAHREELASLRNENERLQALRDEVRTSFRALLVSGLELLEQHAADDGDRRNGEGADDPASREHHAKAAY